MARQQPWYSAPNEEMEQIIHHFGRNSRQASEIVLILMRS
jgi:hypothetical protein